VRVLADGQPQDFDTAFTATRLMAWLAAARTAMASGTPGVALGACSACGTPLLVSSKQALLLPCPHCGETVHGEAADVVVDQWTEPWARVEGAGLNVEYRLTLLEDRTGLSAGCAACGAATPATDPSSRCAQCGAVTWVPRGEGRVQLGVRVDGVRDGKPFKMLVPIVQGEGMLRGDALHGPTRGSGRSYLGATGIGCAVALAAIVFIVLGVWLAVHFTHH
jgi:predicted RNA-binding Zn-ribbon protein involved in translation (DUF1610 family)